jgi:hypothetical protein
VNSRGEWIDDKMSSTVTKSRSCWMSWIMGQDDGAEWVRYIDFSANPRVFPLHGLNFLFTRTCDAKAWSTEHLCSPKKKPLLT